MGRRPPRYHHNAGAFASRSVLGKAYDDAQQSTAVIPVREHGGYSMFERLWPQRLDNEYRGSKLALWIYGLVVLVKSAQSLSIIFAGTYTAAGADGIPLDTLPPAVAQTVLAVFAQQSLWRLTFCLLCWIALLRYRSAVPLMFALLVVNYVAAQVIFHFVPLPRVGAPPGPVINLIVFSLMVVGLALSVWPGTRRARQ